MVGGLLLGLVEPAAAIGGLVGNAEPALDPVPAGEVAVVAASAPVGNRIAFIVQNGADWSVRVAEVTAVAERTDGSQAVRASTTGVVPGRLAPGEVAIGAVTFPSGTVAPSPVLTWKVRWGRAPSGADPQRLAVAGLELSPPRSGAVAQTLTLDVSNPHDVPRAGPLAVSVLCLSEARRPVLESGVELERSKLRPGASAHVVVKLRELCPSYLVGARAGARQ